MDMRQVHRTIDQARWMIKHAFAILEGHFLYDDDSYRKLLMVEYRLRTFEDTVRSTEANDESELFLTLIGALEGTSDVDDRKKTPKKRTQRKQSQDKHTMSGRKLAPTISEEIVNVSIDDSGNSTGTNSSCDSIKTAVMVSKGHDREAAADKSTKGKDTGAVPKPSRTTKHHRKV